MLQQMLMVLKFLCMQSQKLKLRLQGSNREYQMYTVDACVISILHISAPSAYRGRVKGLVYHNMASLQ